jgi:hypothetical protein
VAGLLARCLLAGAGAPGDVETLPLTNPDRREAVGRLAAAVPPEAASAVLASLRRTAELLEKNANARLALEVCLLAWPRVVGEK